MVALLLALTGKPAHHPALKLHDDVVLSAELRQVVTAIADRYHDKTRRTLEITSGVRTAERQAGAMYIKLRQGGSLSIYKQKALVTPIKEAYRAARKRKLKKEAVIAAMAAVIEAQVARGEFLSRHLKGRAFDARIIGMSGKQRAAFLQAAHEVGGVRVLIESHPPHFHVEVLPHPSEPPDTQDDPHDEGAHED